MLEQLELKLYRVFMKLLKIYCQEFTSLLLYLQAICTYLKMEFILPYQPIQTCASSSRRSLLWVIWSKSGVEVFRDRTGRSQGRCWFRLATSLENLKKTL